MSDIDDDRMLERPDVRATLGKERVERAEEDADSLPQLVRDEENTVLTLSRDGDAPAGIHPNELKKMSPEEFRSGLVDEILVAVRAGETVVIHCRGGIGRTGTVAASCLVALGHPPDDAIVRVRAVRPGAVETREQEKWVRAFVGRTETAPPGARVPHAG